MDEAGSGQRVKAGARSEVGWVTWLFAQASGLVAKTHPPNLFLTLGKHRRLFRGWLHFAGRMMPGGTLPRRETECVIIRVAHLCGSQYEFEHHVRLGRRAGVTEADVARLVEGPSASEWSPRERAILEAVDLLHEHRDLDDECWQNVRRYLDERQAIEFVLLVGHYQMLATAITVLRIEPDRRRSRVVRSRRG